MSLKVTLGACKPAVTLSSFDWEVFKTLVDGPSTVPGAKGYGKILLTFVLQG